jgi:ubiquitin C-terminal hydrolase
MTSCTEEDIQEFSEDYDDMEKEDEDQPDSEEESEESEDESDEVRQGTKRLQKENFKYFLQNVKIILPTLLKNGQELQNC